MRTGLIALMEAAAPDAELLNSADPKNVTLPYADPRAMCEAFTPIVGRDALNELRRQAHEAAHGRIVAFSRWPADYGDPIDWFRNPVDNTRWTEGLHWSRAYESGKGDIKYTWEIARFPQAYAMARAATYFPEDAQLLGDALRNQIADFERRNPYATGVHWASGLELGVRTMAWLFALHVFRALGVWGDDDARIVVRNITAGAAHIERYFSYVVEAVYNDHLLGEAVALVRGGLLHPEHPRAKAWTQKGEYYYAREADHQVLADGTYFTQSHNYHRAVLHMWLSRPVFARKPPVVDALRRSADFLYAHQNPDDGRLPNFGSHDGNLAMPLTTCDGSDYRPVIESCVIASRNERRYEVGPWTEEAAWLYGPSVVDLPRREVKRTSAAFHVGGHYVLRGNDERNFSTFRCGTVVERFGQLDLLHVDVFWRGANVLADPGTFSYNDESDWNHEFVRTASHNTVTVDGLDQMLHYRKFKTIYRTKAKLLAFEDDPRYAFVAGEHYGFVRQSGVTHRRAVLLIKDELIVVADTLLGSGTHDARLHWLRAAPVPLAVYDERGARQELDVAIGTEQPERRGWISRYYGYREPAESIAVKRRGEMPMTFVTLIGSDGDVVVDGDRWRVGALGFTLRDGMPRL